MLDIEHIPPLQPPPASPHTLRVTCDYCEHTERQDVKVLRGEGWYINRREVLCPRHIHMLLNPMTGEQR